MKKFLKISLLSMVLFASTQHLYSKEKASQSLGSDLRDSLKQLCVDTIKAAINAYQPYQLLAIWEDKLEQVLETDIIDSAKYYVQEIIDEVSAITFDTSQIIGEEFDLYLTNIWYPYATNHLTNIWMVNIFCDIYDFDPDEEGGVPNGSTCSCNRSSMFGSCQLWGFDCANLPCGSLMRGCGFLSRASCNGMCNDIPEFKSTPTCQ